MLDKLNTNLIKVLNSYCENGSYKILEIEDLLNKLSKYKIGNEELKQNLTFLQERQYLDVKYSDDKEICLCLLPKARIHSEEVAECKKTKMMYFKLAIVSSICSGITAFLGALIAVFIFK